MEKIYDNRVIMFGGGIDSTYLLIKQLEMARVNRNIKLKVFTLNSNLLDSKTNNEAKIKSVRTILNKLKREYCEAHLESYEFEFNMDRDVFDNYEFDRICLFLPTIIAALEENTTILFGYNYDDQIAAFLPRLKNAVKELTSSIQFKNNINLAFPLIGECKMYITRNCLKYNDIFMDISSCLDLEENLEENDGIYYNCEDCPKCNNIVTAIQKEINHNISLMEVTKKGESIKEYQDNISNYLNILKTKYPYYYKWLNSMPEFIYNKN